MLVLLPERPTSDEVSEPKGVEGWELLDGVGLLKPVLPIIEVLIVVHAAHTLQRSKLRRKMHTRQSKANIRARPSAHMRAWHRLKETVRHLPVGSPRRQRMQPRFHPGRSRLLPSTPFRSVWEFSDTSTRGCKCRPRLFLPSWWCRRSRPDLLAEGRCCHSQTPPSFPQSLKFLSYVQSVVSQVRLLQNLLFFRLIIVEMCSLRNLAQTLLKYSNLERLY